MSLLTSLFSPRAASPYQDGDEFWYKPIGYQTQSGIYVGPETGLKVSAVFAAVRLITETLAKVPLITYQRIDENSKTRAVSNPLYSLLHDRPNNWQTSYEYRIQAQANILLRGNHYSQIVPGPKGPIGQLIPLHPDRMTVKMLPGFRLGYLYKDEQNVQRALTQDEVFHLRGPMLSCGEVTGVTPITYARETVGAALTMEAYADALFRNGAMHRGMIAIPGTLNADQRTELRQYIKNQHAGFSGWHSTMVLEAGAKWENIGMTAEDAQFLVSRKFNVIEIARWFNVQPHLLRDLEKSSYSNHEQESLEFAQVTMLPHYVNWEQAIGRDLILDNSRFFAEFLLDAIVRADLKTRYEAWGIGIEKGFMLPNEVRSRDNIGNPLPGGDRPRIPVNISMLDEAGKIIPNPNSKSNPSEGRVSDDRNARQAHYDRLLSATAGQLNGVEIKALKGVLTQSNGHVKDEGLKFYDRFADKLEKFLCLDHQSAQAYATVQAKRFINALETGGGNDLMADLEQHGAERILTFVMRDGIARECAESRAA